MKTWSNVQISHPSSILKTFATFQDGPWCLIFSFLTQLLVCFLNSRGFLFITYVMIEGPK